MAIGSLRTTGGLADTAVVSEAMVEQAHPVRPVEGLHHQGMVVLATAKDDGADGHASASLAWLE